MRLLRSLLVVVAAAVLLAPAAPAVAAPPFKADLTLRVAYAPSPLPGHLTLTTSGTGRAAHLGRLTVTSTETLDLVSAPGSVVVRDGRMVLVAANGDELHLDYSGTGSAPDEDGVITIAATFVVTGGTGRFTDATGSGTIEGTAVSDVVSVSYLGTIDY